MKRLEKRKLTLSTETMRRLDDDALAQARGGQVATFIGTIVVTTALSIGVVLNGGNDGGYCSGDTCVGCYCGG